MSNQQPLVTAYIPTKNRAESVKKAVQSVLEQTWKNMEIIVVDDASDDETPDILEELAQSSNIKVIRNETPKGAAASRNIAIEQANGEFVAGLDDDDIWRPKRIEYLYEGFTDGISGTCSNDRMIFGEREAVWKKKETITLQDLLYYNQVGNQVLTKKEYILEVGGYDETLPSAQDYDLWIRLAHDFGPIKCVPHTLQVVNMSDDRESITTSDSQIDGYRACFEKHRHKMNKEQETYQLYRIKMAAGKKISWFEMFRSVPSQLLVKEITRKLFL